MEKLRLYLNSLTAEQQAAFASACQTTMNYLRKAISAGQQLGIRLCIAIERESKRAVTCEDLVPDADWAFIRAGGKREQARAQPRAGRSVPNVKNLRQ
jgi:DNA-binding transcriptional regulator YdaS (Cro superfamily)